MKRLLALVAALLVTFALSAPAALAADGTMPHNGRVLVATEGDLTVPAGEHADLVVVTGGTATIEGEVNTIIVVDGVADLRGARTETLFAVRSPVTLGAGTVVTGDVMKLDSEVTRMGDARIEGGIRDIALDLAGLGLFLGPALVLLYLGFTVAAIAAALLLAALAARQVRVAEQVISREPVMALAAGILGVVAPIFLIAALFVSIVGVPLALGIMLGLLPLAAFVGYLLAGIWIGDWVLSRTADGPGRERPYLAAVIGMVILQVLGILPVLPMIASLFGYGALLIVSWRTFRGQPTTPAPVAHAAPMPMAG